MRGSRGASRRETPGSGGRPPLPRRNVDGSLFRRANPHAWRSLRAGLEPCRTSPGAWANWYLTALITGLVDTFTMVTHVKPGLPRLSSQRRLRLVCPPPVCYACGLTGESKDYQCARAITNVAVPTVTLAFAGGERSGTVTSGRDMADSGHGFPLSGEWRGFCGLNANA